jgi:RNA polymerase sigma-70 factor, ECF subfamily
VSNAAVTTGDYLVAAAVPMRTLLEDTYEQSHQQLCAVAARYVGPDAEDVVQDVFVRALQTGDAFRHEASAATWLHRIAVNICIDRWRRQRRRPEIVADLESIDRSFAAPVSADPSDTILVRSALQVMSADDQRLCILYYVMGYSHREIATALGIGASTSKSRLHAVRTRLRRALA